MKTPSIDYGTYNSAWSYEYKPGYFIQGCADKNGEYISILTWSTGLITYVPSEHAAKCLITRRINKEASK